MFSGNISNNSFNLVLNALIGAYLIFNSGVKAAFR